MKCRKCGINLNSENWLPSCRKNHYHICRDCNRKYHLGIYYKFREKRLEQKRAYNRKNFLTINGEHFRVKKRTFYEICELCGKLIKKNPSWHHWDDEHLEWGLWLDWDCHRAVEASEKNGIVIPLYDRLKQLIESEKFDEETD